MSITIKRRWNAEMSKYEFRAAYNGAGGNYYNDGNSPMQALRNLDASGMIAGFIFADTLWDRCRNQCEVATESDQATIADLRKKNAALRREIKGLKGK